MVSLLSAIALHRPLLRLAPGLLERREQPVKSDVIVVLGGDSSGRRVEKAVALFRARFAPKILMSGGAIYQETSWAELMRRQAVQLGVPAESIVVQGRSSTTHEDATFSAEVFMKLGFKSAILVTSPWHSGRASREFLDAAPGVRLTSCPSALEWEGDWWRDHNGARAIASEVLKIVWREPK